MDRFGGRSSGFRNRRLETLQRLAIEGGDFAGDTVHVHAVDAVRGDVEVEDRIAGNGFDTVHGQSRERQVAGKAAGLGVEVDVFTKPGERDLHAAPNCSRNRRSPA